MASNLYYETGIEAGSQLRWIAPRVGQHPSLTKRVIAGKVDVAMDPQSGFALDNEPAQVRGEGWIARIAIERRRNGFSARRMVSDDDHLLVFEA